MRGRTSQHPRVTLRVSACPNESVSRVKWSRPKSAGGDKISSNSPGTRRPLWSVLRRRPSRKVPVPLLYQGPDIGSQDQSLCQAAQPAGGRFELHDVSHLASAVDWLE